MLTADEGCPGAAPAARRERHRHRGRRARGNRLQLQREPRRLRPGFPACEASPKLLAAIGGVEATPLTLIGNPAGKPIGWIRGYMLDAPDTAGLGLTAAPDR